MCLNRMLILPPDPLEGEIDPCPGFNLISGLLWPAPLEPVHLWREVGGARGKTIFFYYVTFFSWNLRYKVVGA